MSSLGSHQLYCSHPAPYPSTEGELKRLVVSYPSSVISTFPVLWVSIGT
jgi:hypothetical protein